MLFSPALRRVGYQFSVGASFHLRGIMDVNPINEADNLPTHAARQQYKIHVQSTIFLRK